VGFSLLHSVLASRGCALTQKIPSCVQVFGQFNTPCHALFATRQLLFISKKKEKILQEKCVLT